MQSWVLDFSVARWWCGDWQGYINEELRWIFMSLVKASMKINISKVSLPNYHRLWSWDMLWHIKWIENKIKLKG